MWWRRKKKEQPTIAEAFRYVEEALQKIELAGFILQDTEDFQKVPNAAVRRKCLAEFHRQTSDKTFAFRDELLITLQTIPGVRIRRKNGAILKAV